MFKMSYCNIKGQFFNVRAVHLDLNHKEIYVTNNGKYGISIINETTTDILYSNITITNGIITNFATYAITNLPTVSIINLNLNNLNIKSTDSVKTDIDFAGEIGLDSITELTISNIDFLLTFPNGYRDHTTGIMITGSEFVTISDCSINSFQSLAVGMPGLANGIRMGPNETTFTDTVILKNININGLTAIDNQPEVNGLFMAGGIFLSIDNFSVDGLFNSPNREIPSIITGIETSVQRTIIKNTTVNRIDGGTVYGFQNFTVFDPFYNTQYINCSAINIHGTINGAGFFHLQGTSDIPEGSKFSTIWNNCTAELCTAIRDTGNGFEILGDNNCTILNCISSSNSTYGIQINQRDENAKPTRVIKNNIISDNGTGGVFDHTKNSDYIDNTIVN